MICKLKLVVLFCFLIMWAGFSAKGQGSNTIWYFGQNAGVDFNTGSPVPLYDGALSTSEGCATYTNSQGDLLMYTDGLKVYNRLHAVMPNGTNLLGNFSSTQSAIIVPKPGSTTLYYIFTTGAGGFSARFCYSIVDMQLDNGLGEVTIKNVILNNSVNEQLAAVKHANNVDYWIMVKTNSPNAFSAYLLSASGVSSVPVQTITSPGGGYVGQLKFSPDGSRLAQAFYGAQIILCDFDASTGLVTNPNYLATASGNGYGIEFSPSGRFLYCATTNQIYQWDLQLPTIADIAASRQALVPVPSFVHWSLQLAYDGKIYVAQTVSFTEGSFFLGIIENPEMAGTQANYVAQGVNLSPKLSNLGLPNFIHGQFFVPVHIQSTSFCYGSATHFSVQQPSAFQIYLWDFGDPGSGLLNTSTDSMPSHIFSSPGNYTVSVVGTIGTQVIIQSTSITILPSPVASIAATATTICPGQSVTLSVQGPLPGHTYSWSTGDTTTFITVSPTQTSTYTLTAHLAGCSTTATSAVSVIPLVIAAVAPDPEICAGQSTILSASGANNYTWQPGNQIGSTVTVSPATSTVFTLLGSSGSCSASATVTVIVNPLPAVSLSPGQSICAGQNATLTASGANTFTWQPGNLTGASITVVPASTTTYTATGTTNGCFSSATVAITVNAPGPLSVTPDVEICPGTSTQLAVFPDPDYSYTWSPAGSLSNPNIPAPLANPEVSTLYHLTVNADDCVLRDSVLVTVAEPPAIAVSANPEQGVAPLPVQFSNATTGATGYSWHFGDGSSASSGPEPLHTYQQPGNYWVLLTSHYGPDCHRTDTVALVRVEPASLLPAPNIITPNSDGANDALVFRHIHKPFDLRVYNRWGKLVFERSNYHLRQDWQAQGLPGGLYYYHIIAADGKEWKGWVEVVR